MRTMESVLERHGRRESLELSKVQIGLETAELQKTTRLSTARAFQRLCVRAALKDPALQTKHETNSSVTQPLGDTR